MVWRQRERGWFPSNYVRRITDQEAELARAQLDLALNQINSTNEQPSSMSLTHHPSSSHSSRHSVVSSIWDGHGQIHESETTLTPQDQGSHLNTTSQSHSMTDTIPANSSANSLSTDRNSDVRPSNWVDWLPRVTNDGQIQYYNTLTGELASEMPSAEDDLDEDDRDVNHAVAAQVSKATEANDSQSLPQSEPLAFLERLGFGSEQLQRHGILPSHLTCPNRRSYTPSTHPVLSLDQDHAPVSHSHRLSTSTLTTAHTLPIKNLFINRTSTTRPSFQPRSMSVVGNNRPDAASLFHLPVIHSHSSDALRGPGARHHGTRSITHSNRSSRDQISSARLDSSDVVMMSEQVKNSLRPSLAIPATSSLRRIKLEVQKAIDAVAELTAPYPDGFLMNMTLSDAEMDKLSDEALTPLRNKLSSASLNLGAMIRHLLQASCQSDTAVLSVLRDSASPAGFGSLLSGQASSISTPTSPYAPHLDPGLPIMPYDARSISQHAQPYPELKPVTRRIASTLSKLTLSTRAFWGLLSTSPSNRPDDNPESGVVGQSVEPVEPVSSGVDRKAIWQARFTLEQKLRTECKMGISDLSSNVELFFNHLELLLAESKNVIHPSPSLDPSPQPYLFPRHGIGHLSMSLESLLLPGGSKGGNWQASGFHNSSATTSPRPSSLAQPTLATNPKPPSIRLTLDWFAHQLSPTIKEAIETSNATTVLFLREMPQDPNDVQDSDSSARVALRDTKQDWLETLLSHITDLLDSVGSLLDTAEALDLSSSLHMDLDSCLWLDKQRALSERPQPGALSADHLANTLNRLRSSRQLVDEFLAAKQGVYDLVSELNRAAHILMTSPDGCGFTPTISPAQPPFASPLFAIYAPIRDATGRSSLSASMNNLVLRLEILNQATRSLAIEADEQSKLEADFGGNNLVKQYLTSDPSAQWSTRSSASRTSGGQKGRRGSYLSQGTSILAGTSSGISPPSSPQTRRTSRGIEEEQAENDLYADGIPPDASPESLSGYASIQRLSLQPPSFVSSAGSGETIDRTSIDSTKRTSLAEASVWSYQTSSSAKSERSAEQLANLRSSTHINEVPSLPIDGESGAF